MKEEEIKIEYLQYPINIQTRPGMYCGSVDNFDVPFREIIDNSCDEVSQGYGDTIIIEEDFNGYLLVCDNGRGMPCTMADGEFSNITQTELSLTTVHSGSKFKALESGSRVGMNGAAQAMCNALSDEFIIMCRITPDNYNKSITKVEKLWNSCGPRSKKDLFYILVYERGYKKFEGAGKLRDIEKRLFSNFKTYKSFPENQSTIVMFKAHSEIFESTSAKIPYINLQYFLLIQEKFFNRRINIIANGNSLIGQFKPYKYELLTNITPKDNSVNKSVGVYITFEVDEKNLGGKDIIGSINGLPSAGFHLSTAENCFKAALKDFYKIKRDTTLTNGLKLCVVVLAQEVLFSSQTKENLKSITKVKPADFAPVVKGIEKIFKKNPDYWEPYIAKLQALHDSMRDIGAQERAQKMIDAASNANQLYKNKQNLVDGFVDATSTDRWNCELMIVEGLSPAGSLISARKADQVKRIGCLPLRGKVLDTSGITASKMLDNKEMGTLFTVIGLGLDCHSVVKDAKTLEEAYEIIKKKSRYGKIILCQDSDEDGLSIRRGLLYTFAKFARFMIDLGCIYYISSPIFEQGGKYFYPEDPRIPGSQFCVGMDPNKKYRRFKGLGALNRDDVFKSFYDENMRRLIQVTSENIDIAMGLAEDINKRKDLLYNKGILTNPYNFTDL